MASLRTTRGLWLRHIISVSALSALDTVLRGTASAAEPVKVLHAESLTPLFEKEIVPALQQRGVAVSAEGHGSVANANMIRAGLKRPDVFISADADVTKRMLGSTPVKWYATFATTRLVLAYSAGSKFAGQFRKVGRGDLKWYDVLQEPGLRMVRTDPALDPRGYRIIIAFQLAEQYYHRPMMQLLGGFRNPDQILSDEGILLRLDQGEADAAILYEIQAVGRKIPYIRLPPEIDLSDPARSASYRRASVTIGDRVHVGEAIQYALTIPADAGNPKGAIEVVRFLLSGEGRRLFERAGFRMPPIEFYGDTAAVPPEIGGKK